MNEGNIVIYMGSMSTLDLSSTSAFNWGDISLTFLMRSSNTYLNRLGLLVLQGHFTRSSSPGFSPPDSQDVWFLIHLPSRAVNVGRDTGPVLCRKLAQ